MRSRALLIGASGLALAAVAAVLLARPLLAEHARGLIEARLARTTGLTWRIGRVDPGLFGLTLDTVSAEGSGLQGRIERVRASGPFSLLLGGGGTVTVALESARLSLPLAAAPASLAAPAARPFPAAGGPSLAALRGVVRGADAALAEDGRTLALAAAGADLILELTETFTGRDPTLRLELPERGALIEVEAAPPDAARPMQLTLATEGAPRLTARASAALRSVPTGPSTLRLDAVEGTLDRAPFSGSLIVTGAGSGAKPRLALDLRLDALALADAEAVMRVDPVAGITVPVRADLIPEPRWFAGYEADAAVAVARLAAGPARAEGVKLAARVRAGRLDASLDGAALYGGTARGRYVLEPEGASGRHQIGLSLSAVRVGPLLQDVAGVSSLDGTGNGRLDVQALGTGGRALLGSARGLAEVSVTQGRIDGLDLARASGATSLPGGLATRLDRLGASFSLGDGRATTDDLQVATGLVEAQGAGALDLMARTIDLRLKPLKVAGGGRLNVPIQISGPWSGPAVTADLAGLAQDPAGTLQGLQNLGNSLFGNDAGTGSGTDIGGALGGLLDALMPPSDRAPTERPLPDRGPRRRP